MKSIAPIGIVAMLVMAGSAPAGTIDPAVSLQYQGAFRTTEGEFSWSNGGMAYYPIGDGGNGSLLLFGHSWRDNMGELALDYTTLKKKSEGAAVGDLDAVTVLNKPNPDPNVDEPGYASGGLEYLASTDKLYHVRNAGGPDFGGKMDRDGTNDDGPKDCMLDNRAVGEFLAEIPSGAAVFSSGLSSDQNLVTGFDWAEYGNGCTIGALDGDAASPMPGTYLVQYRSADSMNNWDRDDQWKAGAWLEQGADSALLVGGTKDITNMGGDSVAADDLKAWMMFYDPADLAAVVGGTKNTWEPQAYATLNIQDVMFDGSGIKSMAYDRANNVIYAQEDQSTNGVIHVWNVATGPVLPHPGDAQPDGKVDGGDYTIWADNYGKTDAPAWSAGGWTVGNFTEDANVDGGDYTVWADNYGYGTGAAAVPEPACGLLLVVGVWALRRRRRSA